MIKKFLSEFDDFEVISTNTDHIEVSELYSNFIKFSETFEQLPKAELLKRGWMDSKEDKASLYPLLREINKGRAAQLYRKADGANEAKCALWMSAIASKSKIYALSQDLKPFDGLDKSDLKSIAQLSVDENIVLNLPTILREKGIILLYEQALPGMKLDGVVFKLESGHPVVGVSFRYPRLDNFWFTLLHELAHIVLHWDHLDNPIYEDLDSESEDVIEIQANRLAKASFVRRSDWRNCEPRYNRNIESVEKFAREHNVHPAIIAGMLRKEENNYKIFNGIVNRIDIRRMVFNND